MKTKTAACIAAMSLMALACDNKDTDNAGVQHYDTIAPGANLNTERDHTEVNEEVSAYRQRINQRLDELRSEIDERRAKRETEKNADRQKEYDEDIERRERTRANLQEKLNNMESRVETGWENFKREVDELFDEDRKNNTDR